MIFTDEDFDHLIKRREKIRNMYYDNEADYLIALENANIDHRRTREGTREYYESLYRLVGMESALFDEAVSAYFHKLSSESRHHWIGGFVIGFAAAFAVVGAMLLFVP